MTDKMEQRLTKNIQYVSTNQTDGTFTDQLTTQCEGGQQDSCYVLLTVRSDHRENLTDVSNSFIRV